MINVIAEWVRSITIILLLSLFLEMLIPNSNLKRYVRVIIGLFIIMIILNPFMSILRAGEYHHISVFTEQQSVGAPFIELEKIIEDGKQIQTIGTQKAHNVLEEKIAYQVEGLAGLVEGVGRAKASVRLLPDFEPGSMEQIQSIDLQITMSSDIKNNKQITAIEPIVIKEKIDHNENDGYNGYDSNKELMDKKRAITNKIKSALTSFYSVKPEQIDIVFTK